MHQAELQKQIPYAGDLPLPPHEQAITKFIEILIRLNLVAGPGFEPTTFGCPKQAIKKFNRDTKLNGFLNMLVRILDRLKTKTAEKIHRLRSIFSQPFKLVAGAGFEPTTFGL